MKPTIRPNRKDENHHFVPQFYLRHWANATGRMWIYPLDGRNHFQASPKSFAGVNGLYDASNIQDLIPDDRDDEADLGRIEDLFATRWPSIFDEISNPESKKNMACFLALVHLRNPKRLEEARELNKAYRNIVAGLPEGAAGFRVISPRGDRVLVRKEDVHKYAQETPRHTKASFLNAMRRSVFTLADILVARKWGVIFSDVPAFVTSDSPLVLNRGTCERDKFGFGTPGTIVTFPISPTKLLFIADNHVRDGLHYPLIDVGDANSGTIRDAARFIFSQVELPEELTPESMD